MTTQSLKGREVAVRVPLRVSKPVLNEGKIKVEMRPKKDEKRAILEVVMKEIKKAGDISFVNQFEKALRKIDIQKLEKDQCIKIVLCDADITPPVIVINVYLDKLFAKMKFATWKEQAEKHKQFLSKKTSLKKCSDW
ncbi:MAG: hypothetical protein V2A63_03895 [Patescibacteria group bacterium]